MSRTNFSGSRFSQSEVLLLVLLFSASFAVCTGIQMGSALFPGLARLMDVPIGRITLLTSIWAFTGLLSPVFGPLSDRYGHGTFVSLGLGAFVLGNILSALAPNFIFLMACQVVVGLGYAIFSFSGSALIGEVFRYETRARAMGVVRFSLSAACLVGVPAAVALAGEWTARASFGAVSGLSILVLMFLLFLLPRVSLKKAQTSSRGSLPAPWLSAFDVLRQLPAFRGLVAVLVWAMLPTGAFIYLAAWLQDGFRLTEAQIGIAFSLVGVGSLLGNGLTAAFTDRIGKKRSALIGLIALSIALILLPRSPNIVMALVGVVIFVAALDFGFTSFGTLMTELAPENRGTLMSLVALANGIGTGLTPLILRPIWESGGYLYVTFVLGIVGLCSAIFLGLLIDERAVAHAV